MSSPFSFLSLPTHPPKPRNVGLFIPGDSGLPLRLQKDFLEENHDLVDYVKFTGHGRLLSRHPRNWFERKIAHYSKYRIGAFPGGIAFEVALLQGRTKEFFHTLKELGFMGVEISEDVIPPMPAAARRDTIGEATTAGLTVFTEVGRKFPEEPLNLETLVQLIRADLDSGAFRVTIERSEIVALRDSNPQLLVDTANAAGFENLIFESHLPGPELMVWLIQTLGPEVNLMGHMEYCGVAHDCRLGMHRSVGYSFLTRKAGKIQPHKQEESL
ncbi:MAG: phosphosulfolactate synthase [Deltaproteobacteria bacterium]|nr:phosphosulfolactate synthase [Deltaproteobacteria bacterium]